MADLTKSLGNAVGAIGKMNGALTKLNPGLMIVKGSLDLVTAALNRNAEFLNEGVKINERLLITNQTYAQFAEKNAEALSKNTVGFAMSSKILTEANILGLQGNALQRQNLVEAVGRMKITGQNTQAMLGLALKTEQMTLADQKSSELLAKSITATAAQYGIAADKIVKAVGDLDFTMQTATGASPLGLQNLITSITGENQQRGEVAAQLINAVSRMEFGKAIALGIAPEFKALREGSLTRQGFERMMDTLEQKLGFGSITEMAPAMVESIFGIGADLQARIRAERQLAGEPAKQKMTFDGIAASLAAQEQRANSDSEMRAAMMESGLITKEASIAANGFLSNISMAIVGPIQEFALTSIRDIGKNTKIAETVRDRLGVLDDLNKKSEDLLNYSIMGQQADEKLVNAAQEGVRIQQEELHRSELERADATRNLQNMMSARLNDNDSEILLAILDRIGDQVAVAQGSLNAAEDARVNGMLRNAEEIR